MHPAKSVIFFTTASGAGYGLFVLMAVFAALGRLPPDPWLGLVGLGLALGLVGAGLISSAFHLGHPERAWRAMSQWRSSWLSREGLAALLTFLPTGLFAMLWVVFGATDGAAAWIGLAGAAMCALTVYCTAMIYASLRPVHAWANAWVPSSYLVLALMSGAVLLATVARLLGVADPAIGAVALAAIAAGWAVKVGYWRHINATHSASTAESATGLGALGRVHLLDPPNTESNYLMQEMGFRIARKHAVRLRRLVHLAGFAAPLSLNAAALWLGGAAATALTVLAALSAALGLLVERWLFFAEAKHTVTLYYGREHA